MLDVVLCYSFLDILFAVPGSFLDTAAEDQRVEA
jgi:hypothetical protein